MHRLDSFINKITCDFELTLQPSGNNPTMELISACRFDTGTNFPHKHFGLIEHIICIPAQIAQFSVVFYMSNTVFKMAVFCPFDYSSDFIDCFLRFTDIKKNKPSDDKICKINFLSKLHFKLILARTKTGGKNGIINFLSKENKSAKHFCSDVDNVVVAQWAKRLLPTPEDMGSNPEMSIFIVFL